MDLSFLKMFLQLFIALSITLGLMFLCYKVFGNSLAGIGNKKYIQIIERTQVTKDNFILIAKAGKKGYILSSTPGRIEKLAELSEGEIKEIEASKKENDVKKENVNYSIMDFIKKYSGIKGKENYEKT